MIVVEGNHEKNTLFSLLIACFPELKIKDEDIWIYKTNIHVLISAIGSEYGDDWYEQEVDIDIPFVVSKKDSPSDLRYSRDFKNIFLIFDYERQDTYFSANNLLKMQEYFKDSSDMGKLFLNYPMVESYQHCYDNQDHFENLSVSVQVKPGVKYKELVYNGLQKESIFFFPQKMCDVISEYGVQDVDAQKCSRDLLALRTGESLMDDIEHLSIGRITADHLKTFKYWMKSQIDRIGYGDQNQNYYEHIRSVLIRLVLLNIRKAYSLQGGNYHFAAQQENTIYPLIRLVDVLKAQNQASRDEMKGIIYILNTSLFIIPDYDSALLDGQTLTVS